MLKIINLLINLLILVNIAKNNKMTDSNQSNSIIKNFLK